MAYVQRGPLGQGTTTRDVVDRWMESTFGPWWNNFWNEGARPATSAYSFPVDIYESPEHYLVLAALPGINPDDVQITALNGTLTIACEVKPQVSEGYTALYREMAHGPFRRDVRLPGDFALDAAEATYESGMLKLVLPKAEHLKLKSLRVKVVK